MPQIIQKLVTFQRNWHVCPGFLFIKTTCIVDQWYNIKTKLSTHLIFFSIPGFHAEVILRWYGVWICDFIILCDKSHPLCKNQNNKSKNKTKRTNKTNKQKTLKKEKKQTSKQTNDDLYNSMTTWNYSFLIRKKKNK